MHIMAATLYVGNNNPDQPTHLQSYKDLRYLRTEAMGIAECMDRLLTRLCRWTG